MTSERWARIRTLLEAAVALPEDQRTGYIESNATDGELRDEALRMLRFEQEASRMFRIDGWQNEAAAMEMDLAGQMLGSYRLRRELGRGGMGAVYLAERADGVYDQQVAIKVLQEKVFTPALAERFREERQILATLNHAGIARLLDGGVSPDGRPFLVLEYVDGEPIDSYCEDTGMNTAGKLRLFLKVAAAVQSAHQQLILHLDLKPANILITADGEPHLLDFGISRMLVAGETGTRQAEETLRLLTPRYASPEQAAGTTLGVASDIFSLTTLLYRMLTGTLPYPLDNVPPLEAARILREVEPMAPGRVRQQLRGDLDAILLKGLRKEPERRYATVAALADDVERYLASRPVLAHACSFRYRAGKFSRRHRVGLSAVATIFAVLTASIFLVTHAAIVARRAERLAEKRLLDERDLAHSYVFELEPMLENIPGTVKVRNFILQHALQYLHAVSNDMANDDDLAAEVSRGYMGLGQIQGDGVEPSLSDRAGAWDSMKEAYRIQKRLFDRKPADLKRRGFLIVNLRLMSFLATADGDIERSDKLSREAWDLAQPIIAAGPAAPRYMTVTSVVWDLANNRGGNGGTWSFADPDGALQWLDRMHDLLVRYQAAGAGNPKIQSDAATQLHRESMSRATVYRQIGRNEEARARYDAALREWNASPTHSLTELQSFRVIHYNYADFLLSVGDAKGAAAMAPPLAEAKSHEAGADRSEMRDEADILGLLARIDLRNGRVAEGRKKMQRSLETFEAIYKADPDDSTSTEELSSTCFDLAEEPLLDHATRKRLYLRELEIIAPYVRSHPTVYSALADASNAALGLATLANEEHDETARDKWAGQARQGFNTVLATHPQNPQVRARLQALENLSPASRP